MSLQKGGKKQNLGISKWTSGLRQTTMGAVRLMANACWITGNEENPTAGCGRDQRRGSGSVPSKTTGTIEEL